MKMSDQEPTEDSDSISSSSSEEEESETGSQEEQEGSDEDSNLEPEGVLSSNVFRCSLYIVIAIVFYIGLGIVIAVANDFADVEGIETSTRTLVTSNSSCSADSFLINDGVCDEVTNRPRCLYDGGDCCLDTYKKRTHYCQDCTCRQTISDKDHQMLKERLQVAVLNFSSNEMLHLFEPLGLFNDVDSVEVCAWLCTNDEEGELPSEINSWIFSQDKKSCTCTVILSNEVCADEIVGSIITNEWLFVKQTKVNVDMKCIDTVGISTGFPLEQGHVTQVIAFGRTDPENDQWNCEDYGASPVNVGGSVGGVFKDGTAIICGGYNGFAVQFERKCHILSPPTGINSGIREIFMNQPRYMAASVVVLEGSMLFIAGGYVRSDGEDLVQDTVETITLTDFPQPGPALPLGLAGHCLVKINDSLILAIGGRFESVSMENLGQLSPRTFWHSLDRKSWITGPELDQRREGHSCGATMDPNSKTVFVIVAGGFTVDEPSADSLATTEILTLASSMDMEELEAAAWTRGPDLPEGLSFARFAGVNDDSKLLLIGGNGADNKYKRTIYTWTCFQEVGGCQQSLSRRRLPSGRSGFVVLGSLKDINCTTTTTKISNATATITSIISQTCARGKTTTEGQNIPSTSQLCCHGGQLCLDAQGSCRRDADCYGDLVCGCANCQHSFYSVFSSRDNCCTKTKERCFYDTTTPSFNLNATTESSNDSRQCLTDADCPMTQACVGDCRLGLDSLPFTCCVNTTTVPEPCCDEELLSIGRLDCSSFDLEGHYVRFSAGQRIATWAYIQVGNYHSKLYLEQLTFEERITISARRPQPSHWFQLSEIGDFKPPAWVLATTNTIPQFADVATMHLAFLINDIATACPITGNSNNSDSQDQEWKCYSDLFKAQDLHWVSIYEAMNTLQRIASVEMKCTTYLGGK